MNRHHIVALKDNTFPKINGEWLLVIDMQYAFASSKSPWFVPRFSQILPGIEKLVTSYESKVIIARYVPPTSATNHWKDYLAAFPTMNLPHDHAAWDTLLDCSESTIVETRTGFSKWDELISKRIGPGAPIAICGVATECCVLSTVFSVIETGRRVRVFEDLCAGSSDDLHDKTFDILRSLNPAVEIANAISESEQK